jgi:glutamyl-tRNA reductase
MHEIIARSGISALRVRRFTPIEGVRSIMNDFNRKVEDASARVSKKVAEAAEQIEKEIPEFIKYLNDEVVPAVRQHSTKALRVASEKLSEFADYMEKHPQPPK